MHEIVAEILSYLQSAARYKWVAAIFAWLFCVLGWIFVSQIPDRFEANARVHVDTRSVLRPLLTGLTIQPDVSGRIRLMSKLMFSRPNLEKVARMTDLDLGVKNDQAMEKLVTRLQESMKITGGESDLFTIGFQDPDPKIAKKVVQALLTIFVEQTLGESRQDSNSAQKFLDQQIKEYELRLQNAEKIREDYKRSHYGLLPGQGGNLGELDKLAGLLEETRMQIQETTHRRDEFKHQLEAEQPDMPQLTNDYAASSAMQSPLDTRILALEERLDELMLKFTAGHPEVIAVKKSLAELRRKKQQEEAAAAQAEAAASIDSPGPAATNPVFQQKKLMLGEIEANLASLNSRAKMYEQKMAALQQQMDQRLKVETELAAINRDYATLQANYNTLLSRREQARMSENVEQNADSVKFRIVDPPTVPTKPAAPNRILLSSLVLGGGIASGFGLALFMALLRPAFTSIQKLREITGVPVLGGVSMNWMPAMRKQKWHQFLGFVVSYGVLLAVYAGVIVLSIKGYHLPPLV